MSSWRIGIVGGSGLYDIEGLEDARWEHIASPWGDPSDDVRRGVLHGIELAFLPRHGRGHRIPPSEINYRANIDVLKRAGCTDIVSLSACGSLVEEAVPGDFVVVDQFIDRTVGRESSFFGPGLVAHVSMADPVCPRLSGLLADVLEGLGARVHRGGTYLAMEGPQFSSRAESRLYKSWGASVIGMTNLPEARLAREAELPYATVAMVTDYDAWRSDAEPASVAEILGVMKSNVGTAKSLIRELSATLARLPRAADPMGIERCLDHALMTAKEAWSADLVARLDAVAGRVLVSRGQ